MSENKMTKYIHDNYIWMNIQFKTDSVEDMEIYKWIKKQKTLKKESKATYLKRLVKEDMKRAGE